MGGAYLQLSEVMRKWEEHIYNWVKCCVKGRSLFITEVTG